METPKETVDKVINQFESGILSRHTQLLNGLPNGLPAPFIEALIHAQYEMSRALNDMRAVRATLPDPVRDAIVDIETGVPPLTTPMARAEQLPDNMDMALREAARKLGLKGTGPIDVVTGRMNRLLDTFTKV